MKKIQLLFLIGACLFSFQKTNAQCTPDPAYTVVGFYPIAMPSGQAGVAYDENIQVVFPLDTTIDLGFATVSAEFCSFVLDTLFLPPGLSYQCDQPNCEWTIDHSGVINRGCVNITGTPTHKLPNDTLSGVIRIIPGLLNAAGTNCNVDSLKNQLGAFWPVAEQLLTQELNFPFMIDGNNVGVEEQLNKTELGLVLYPNPTDGSSTLSFELAEASEVTVNVMDITGRQLFALPQGYQSAGQKSIVIPGEQLSSGIYLVQLRLNDNAQLTQKLSVQR